MTWIARGLVLCALHLRSSVAGETELKEAELRTSLSVDGSSVAV